VSPAARWIRPGRSASQATVRRAGKKVEQKAKIKKDGIELRARARDTRPVIVIADAD
jgi:hypothetical protein